MGSPPSGFPHREQSRQPHSRRELNQTGQWKIPLWSLPGRAVAAAIDQGLLGTWLSGSPPAEPPSRGGGGWAGRESQEPGSLSTGPWGCLVKTSFQSEAVFQIWEPVAVHSVSLWLSRKTGDRASYHLIYSLGVFLTHKSLRRGRLNYGCADAGRWTARSGSLCPAWEPLPCLKPWPRPAPKCVCHPSGPCCVLGWTADGQGRGGG